MELRGAYLHCGGPSESGLVIFINATIAKVDELSFGSGGRLLDALDTISSIEILTEDSGSWGMLFSLSELSGDAWDSSLLGAERGPTIRRSNTWRMLFCSQYIVETGMR